MKSKNNYKFYLIGIICLLTFKLPILYAESWCDELVGVWTFIGYIIRIAYVATPLLLIVSGSITFFKAIADTKDPGAVKKAQSKFIHKIIAALLVFLMVTIMKIAVSIIGDDGWMKCAQCAINPGSGNCKVNFRTEE